MMIKYFTDKGTWVIRSNIRKVEWCWSKADKSPWGEGSCHEKIENIMEDKPWKTVLMLLQQGDVESEQVHILETNSSVYILNENGKTVESF
jgi:hypothetical protein